MSTAPARLVTGERVPVRELPPHVIVHLEPHQVGGRTLCTRERDVEVQDVHLTEDRLFIALDWTDAPCPGSSDRRRGTVLYARGAEVTVIGRGAAAQGWARQRRAEIGAGLDALQALITRARRAAAGAAW